MNRSIAIVAALVGLVVLAPSAAADTGSGDTSAPDPSTTTTTTSPTTETPVTTTETPVTTTPATTTTETPATTTTDTPTTTEVATTTTVPATGTPTTTATGTDVPCIADCIPAAEECVGMDCIPSAGGGIPTSYGAGSLGARSLPFTGIEDTIAPILLALTVVLGGVVAWRWAQLRESVARDASTARPIPAKEGTRSGYAAAMRRQLIEQRARQVFTPRVA